MARSDLIYPIFLYLIDKPLRTLRHLREPISRKDRRETCLTQQLPQNIRQNSARFIVFNLNRRINP